MIFLSGNNYFIHELSLQIIKELTREFPGWLAIDDAVITKVYSRFIQGVV